jgi:Tol biopolymer transport system component/predicted Ser/Thr protein kinase
MPLSAGDKLGSYEIVSLIGKGGMGEVYRARDPKLNRDVAIKVLPPALASDTDYLTRFEREAQLLASLNHPNIAAIYGMEGSAIVMELVEGETLPARLPVTEALQVARQIAEALEAAHDKGIVHRDLKPGNIKVTPDGVVKVLDFGLAKAVEKSPPTIPTDSPTLTVRATQAGLILGTAGYMSPEQAAGKPVDRRADIWSFGVILWELLTGKRLFEGETVSHTLADVLRAEIDWNKLPPDTPPAIRELLRRCLERKLKNRLSHIAEARYAIDHLAEQGASAVQPASSSRTPWLIAAVACLLGAAALGWTAWKQFTAGTSAPFVLDIAAPEGFEFAGRAALSPDGRTVAFRTVSAKGDLQIHIRSLDSPEARLLAGTEGAEAIFWSPDSQSIGFQATGQLKRADVSDGSVTTICDVPALSGASWGEQGLILLGELQGPLYTVADTGGKPEPVTALNRDQGERVHRDPEFLPGGRQFLFTIRYADSQKDALYLGSLDRKPPVKIIEAVDGGTYDPRSGNLLYLLKDGSLMARRLERNPPRLAGEAVLIAKGVSAYRGVPQFSVARNGTLLYVPRPEESKAQFAWCDRSGQVLEVVSEPLRATGDFRLSPDQRKVAYMAGTPSEIWILDLERRSQSRFTFRRTMSPRWSPDGKYLYYVASGAIYRKLADGAGEEEVILKDGSAGRIDSISPDGSSLMYLGEGGIWRIPLKGSGKPEPFITSQFVEGGAAVSPDGRWIAYHSNESGRQEIYVEGFPERRGRWQISTDGGMDPSWRADGKELFWRPPSSMMSATIDLYPNSIRPGKPQMLFKWSSPVVPSADGKRFLVLQRQESGGYRPPLVVMQNWTAKLKR